jgi:hypothetical protein
MTFAFLAWRSRDSEKTDSSGDRTQESEVRSFSVSILKLAGRKEAERTRRKMRCLKMQHSWSGGVKYFALIGFP